MMNFQDAYVLLNGIRQTQNIFPGTAVPYMFAHFSKGPMAWQERAKAETG